LCLNDVQIKITHNNIIKILTILKVLV